MSKPWSPRIHLQPYWDGDVYISLYCVLFARKDRKRKVPGCSLKAGPLFPYLIWLRNDLVNACAHSHCPQTAGVLKFTVHNRTKVPPQGGEKAVLWQQQSDSPRHCCLPGPLQHENHGTPWPCVFCTQPKGSVTALLASPCQCWAKHQRGAAGQRHSGTAARAVSASFPPCSSPPSWASHCRDTFCALGELREGKAALLQLLSGLKERLQREQTWEDILTLLCEVGFSCSH